MSYKDNGEGTITDTETDLMWQQQALEKRDWDGAMSYAKGLTIGGHSDWRLPTIDELKTLVDEERRDPAIDPIFTDTKSSCYWSSTTSAGSTSYAWSVYFYDGYADYGNKTGSFYVRCVR